MIHAAMRSASMTQVRLVLDRTLVGMMEASTTRSPSMPWTRPWASTTARRSPGNPIGAVPAGVVGRGDLIAEHRPDPGVIVQGGVIDQQRSHHRLHFLPLAQIPANPPALDHAGQVEGVVEIVEVQVGWGGRVGAGQGEVAVAAGPHQHRADHEHGHRVGHEAAHLLRVEHGGQAELHVVVLEGVRTAVTHPDLGDHVVVVADPFGRQARQARRGVVEEHRPHGQVADHRNPEGSQIGGRADAGAEQDRRGSDRSRREDDLAAVDALPPPVHDDLDTDCPAPLDDHLVDEGVGTDLEVGPSPDHGQVREGGRHADAVALVAGKDTHPRARRRVEVVAFIKAVGHAGVVEGGLKGLPRGPGLPVDRERTGDSMVIRVDGRPVRGHSPAAGRRAAPAPTPIRAARAPPIRRSRPDRPAERSCR